MYAKKIRPELGDDVENKRDKITEMYHNLTEKEKDKLQAEVDEAK